MAEAAHLDDAGVQASSAGWRRRLEHELAQAWQHAHSAGAVAELAAAADAADGVIAAEDRLLGALDGVITLLTLAKDRIGCAETLLRRHGGELHGPSPDRSPSG